MLFRRQRYKLAPAFFDRNLYFYQTLSIMNYSELKKQLLQACYELIHSQADAAKTAMNEHQQAANDYGAPKDRYDSFRAQNMLKRDMFAQQYQRALNNIEVMGKIDFEKSGSTIGPGSLVVTDSAILLVGIGLGKVRVMETDCFVISSQVPLFKHISGLKKGDEYSFNGLKTKIVDVI